MDFSFCFSFWVFIWAFIFYFPSAGSVCVYSVHGQWVFQSTTHQSRSRAHTEQPFLAISDFDTCLSASPSSRAAWYPRLEILESTCHGRKGSVIHVQFVSFIAINPRFSLLDYVFIGQMQKTKREVQPFYFWTNVFLSSSLLLCGNSQSVNITCRTFTTNFDSTSLVFMVNDVRAPNIGLGSLTQVAKSVSPSSCEPA